MDDGNMRHGCLILLSWVLLGSPPATEAAPPAHHLIPRAQTQQFEIAYQVNEEAVPLRAVELWYTFDKGQSWHNYGRDEDNISPMSFTAAQDGLCGLYFVLHNEAGVSGPRPTPDTQPHLWVFIDYTLPIAQLHPPQVIQRPGGRTVVQLRWTAIDAHLTTRPIDLAYRGLPDGAWMDLREHLPNSGRYDWNIPAELSGEVMIRLTVHDRGGHQARTVTSAVAVRTGTPADDKAVDADNEGAVGAKDSAPHRVPTVKEAQRARKLLRKSRWHQLRDEHELAAARLREALTLDPQLPDALVQLGMSMYALGEYAAAAKAQELALQQVPADREALEALAKTLVALKRYDAAEAKLLTIVEHRPHDVEAWLHLGDVAIYRGDEVGARGYYTNAATLRPKATDVVARAQARLDDLSALSRRYRQAPAP